MPFSNVAEPPLQPPFAAVEARRLAEPNHSLSDDDVARLSALGLTTLEVAHDLGNLLQVAGSAIRLIDRNLGDGPRATLEPFIGGAIASIERAAALGRRILDTGRPRTTGDTVVYLDTLLVEILDQIALAVGPSVTISQQIGTCIPAIACHRADMENVILNLVVNSRDAMPEGGNLTLTVERKGASSLASQDRAEVLLSVSDTGCGMSQAVAAEAFRPFFTTKPNDRGTGLGLAMVGAFAGRLGGFADIVSVVGEGTTVTLRLPSCAG